MVFSLSPFTSRHVLWSSELPAAPSRERSRDFFAIPDTITFVNCIAVRRQLQLWENQMQQTLRTGKEEEDVTPRLSYKLTDKIKSHRQGWDKSGNCGHIYKSGVCALF